MAGLYESVISWYMEHMNYFTITVLMAVESSFIPFPSEAVIPPAAWKAAQGDLNLLLVIFFGTVGALIGALVNYYLAKTLGKIAIYRFVSSRICRMFRLDMKQIEKAEHYFVRYGNVSTFFGRLIPVVRQVISIPAGLAGMPLKSFIIYTTLGAMLWNIMLAMLGYLLQSQKQYFEQYYRELALILGGLSILFVVYIVYKGFKKNQNQ